MNIADRIKKIREHFGLTSNEFAKITGIHPVSIRKYETNKMVPGIDVIDKMCEALKLPRMVFEGLPKQYTDYKYVGDFFQQLLLLLDNNTLKPEGFYDIENPDYDAAAWFSLNPELAKYITISINGEIVSLDKIHIELNNSSASSNTDVYFDSYIQSFQEIYKTKKAKRWRVDQKGETKEQRIDRFNEISIEEAFNLMLAGHSWEDYMEGVKRGNELHDDLDAFIRSGGTYYEYISQLDAPETVKNKYIDSYEDAYISELISEELGPYPNKQDWSIRMEWTERKLRLIEEYKKEHPSYKEDARQHDIEQSEMIRAGKFDNPN